MHAGGSRGIVASHNTRRGLSTRCQIRLQTPPMTATSEGDLSPSIDCQCPPSNSVHRRPPSRTVGRREGRGGEGGPRVEFWMLWVHHFSTNSSIRMARAEVERCGGRDRGVRATAQSCFIPIRPAQFSLRRFGGRRVNSCPPLPSPPPPPLSSLPCRVPPRTSSIHSSGRRSDAPSYQLRTLFFFVLIQSSWAEIEPHLQWMEAVPAMPTTYRLADRLAPSIKANYSGPS